MKSLKLITFTKSKLSEGAVALVFASLGAACGSSDTPADAAGDGPSGGLSDGGRSSDGAPFTDGGTSLADGATEDGAAEDVSNAADAASTRNVDLGTAGQYVILAQSGVSTVPTSAVTGNVGLSPAAGSYVTGFSLTADSTNVFSTSTQVTGKVYASDDSPPSPVNLTTAIGDMQLAFTDAAGRAPNVTGLGAGNIGGMTLAPGVYQWSTDLLIPTNVTLAGSASDVWIFQIAQNLTLASATSIVLGGGAASKNIVWEVAGAVALGTTAHLEGIVLSQTSIALATGASIHGRLLAQTAVTLDSSTVVAPAP